MLGMHRSGTSVLAGSLQETGLFLSDVNEWHPHNLKGNRENRDLRELNDDVLSYSGGTWDDPPETLSWDRTHAERRDALIGTFISQRGSWGFKDPRTVLTLPFWRQALPNMKLVGTFRHPMAVAKSLFDREGRHIERSVRLWLRYNAIILDEIIKAPFPCVCFDLPAELYLKKLALIVSKLGLGAGLPPVSSRFFEAQLRHFEGPPTDEGLAPEVRAIYAALCRVSLSVEHNATTA